VSYTEKLTTTQSENLDVRILEIFSRFGIRSKTGSYEWTFDNHQIFKMARALLDSEEARIVKANEPEQRDPTGEKTLLTPVIEAKVAMRQRGIPFAKFTDMFPKFLAKYDTEPVLRQLEISEKDAADPNGVYDGPNLTYDRLNIMRDFVAQQSDRCATRVLINPETLLCLIDTIQHHEYVPRDAPSVTLLMDDYLQSLWLTGTPPTLNNDYDYYNVAVRRCHDPENVFVFPAAYANNYDGELLDQDGISFIANGWFDVGQDADGCDSFTPTLEKGDEVLGWQAMPKYLT
jgi:hypothetical protein